MVFNWTLREIEFRDIVACNDLVLTSGKSELAIAICYQLRLASPQTVNNTIMLCFAGARNSASSVNDSQKEGDTSLIVTDDGPPSCEKCMKVRSFMFIPCQHTCCYECVDKIKSKCPFCNSEIKKPFVMLFASAFYWTSVVKRIKACHVVRT